MVNNDGKMKLWVCNLEYDERVPIGVHLLKAMNNDHSYVSGFPSIEIKCKQEI